MPENLGDAIYTIKLDDTELKQGLAEAEKGADQVGKSFAANGARVAKFAAGAAVSALGMIAPFQQAADEIRKQIATATGASGKELERLSDQTRRVASQWGSDWAAAGEVVAAVSKIPTTSPEQEQAVLDLAASFQRAGGDVTQFQLSVSSSMNTLGLDTADAADLVAHFALTAQQTGVSADLMSERLEVMSAEARRTGFSAQEMGILLSEAAQQGGVALVDFLHSELNTATNEAEGLQIASTILGTSMTDLEGTLQGASQAIAGSSEQFVEQNMETLTATERWQGLRNQVSSFIQEGIEGLPEWAKISTGAFNDAYSFASQHSAALLVVATNTQIMSKATVAAQKVITVFGAVIRVLTTTALGPIVAVITVLAGLALVVATNWEVFKNIFISIWEVVKAAAENAINFIIRRVNYVVDYINNLVNGFNVIAGILGFGQLSFNVNHVGETNFASKSVRSAFGDLKGQITSLDIGELLGNTKSKIAGLFGGDTSVSDKDALAAVENIDSVINDALENGSRRASEKIKSGFESPEYYSNFAAESLQQDRFADANAQIQFQNNLFLEDQRIKGRLAAIRLQERKDAEAAEAAANAARLAQIQKENADFLRTSSSGSGTVIDEIATPQGPAVAGFSNLELEQQLIAQQQAAARRSTARVASSAPRVPYPRPSPVAPRSTPGRNVLSTQGIESSLNRQTSILAQIERNTRMIQSRPPINVNVAGDILESEDANNRIVREMEKAATAGKFDSGPIAGIAARCG